jgi:hypothetical protein
LEVVEDLREIRILVALGVEVDAESFFIAISSPFAFKLCILYEGKDKTFIGQCCCFDFLFFRKFLEPK